MKPPSVSIIIPALNEEETIGNLIDSLQYDPYPKEIIVVDGGSSDQTAKIARWKGARVILEKGKKCPANARNQGVKEAKGEIFCFLDADIERVSKNFVTNAVRHFGKNRIIGVTAKREWIEHSLTERITKSVRDTGLIKMFGKRELKGFKPPNFLRRKCFLMLGGYPLLGFGEDRIFWRKLKKYVETHNYEVVQEASSRFFQHGPRSFRELFKRYEWYGRTVFPYLRVTKSLSERILVFAPFIWLISIMSVFLMPFSFLFLILSIPYWIRLATIIYAGTKNKFCFLIPLLDIVGGTGFLKGILSHLHGGEKLGK